MVEEAQKAEICCIARLLTFDPASGGRTDGGRSKTVQLNWFCEHEIVPFSDLLLNSNYNVKCLCSMC